MISRYNLCISFQQSGDLVEAERCFRTGFEIWPMQRLWANELGNVLLQLGNTTAACSSYEHAHRLRLPQGTDNLALCHEMEGGYFEALALRESTQHLLGAVSRGESIGGQLLRHIGTLPRIMPVDPSEIAAVRAGMEMALRQLTSATIRDREVGGGGRRSTGTGNLCYFKPTATSASGNGARSCAIQPTGVARYPSKSPTEPGAFANWWAAHWARGEVWRAEGRCWHCLLS